MIKTTVDSPPMGSAITRIDNIHYLGMAFKPGFQFQSKIGAKTVFTIGGTAEFSTYLNSSSTMEISSGSTVILSEINQENQIKLPDKQGVGMALEFNNKYLITFDYDRSDWKYAEISLKVNRLNINESYHLGIELAPKYDPLRAWQTTKYRIGALYQTGYMNISGTQISSYGATCGVSFPMRKDRNSINLSLEAGRQGTMNNQLIRETYYKLNISFCLWERWFIPRKYD